VLIYKVPSEPTKWRAAVWRRLKTLGAVYLQNSAAVLPRTDETERALRALRNEIVEKMSGTAVLLSSDALVGEHDIVSAINEARNEEYEEIRDKCADFLAGIDKEIVANHFTFGELEENEEDLAKLKNWFSKVSARDLLGANGRAETEHALSECAEALTSYAGRVYAVADDHL
jgi:uncharacterized protein YdbL (DUF1318 family)